MKEFFNGWELADFVGLVILTLALCGVAVFL